jgi:integral membrane protein
MNIVSIFRIVAVSEGYSYLAFAATMPLKYGLGILWPNKIVGATHGALFLAFMVLLLLVWVRERWTIGRVAAFGLASLLPLVLFVWIDGFLPRNNLDSLLLLRHLANSLL